MSDVVRIKTRTGWRPLSAVAVPLPETSTLELEGLAPREAVRLGPVLERADADGVLRLHLASHEQLGGHVGLVPVVVGGAVVGEVEVVADKMSAAAYATLRADLERTWAGLLFGADPVARVEADLPPPAELWGRVESAVYGILAEPRTVPVLREEPRRVERVRHPRELRPAMLRAAALGRPAMAPVLARDVRTPENAMVADLLRRLSAFAHRHPDGAPTAAAVGALRRHPVVRAQGRAPRRARAGRITWGMRADGRYRQIHRVHRLLSRPELEPTEGPGELRLGVRALPRLYEYWVFLQVLLAAVERYGPPLDPGFEVLGTVSGPGRARLELPRGATVRFPGRISVAFEPEILSSGRGWRGLEYVPHPDPQRPQLRASPDVVVLRDGDEPEMLVLDAKYVGRHWVELAAAEVHAKYARIRLDGVPVVREVLAVHPHVGLSSGWAGYGYVALCPGEAAPTLPLPEPAVEAEPSPAEMVEEEGPVSVAGGGGSDDEAASEVDERDTTVIADQWWMHRALGVRRVDLRDVADACLPTGDRELVMPAPDLVVLRGFFTAAEHAGWRIELTADEARSTVVEAIVARAVDADRRGRRVVVVTGDARVVSGLEAALPEFEVFDELDVLPSL